MSSDPDFHHAANSWLDGTDVDSPHGLLRELLRDNQDAVTAFASLSRMEASLQLAGIDRSDRLQRARRLLEPSLSVRMRRMVARPALYWPAAALLAGGLLWFAFFSQDTPAQLTEPRIANVKVRSVPPAQVSATPRLTQPAAPDATFMQRMSRFIVPEFSARSVSLPDALESLGHAIGSIDREAVPEFTVDPAVRDSIRVHLDLKYQSVELLVKLISVQTGTTFQPSGRGYVITSDPKAIPRDSITSRMWDSTSGPKWNGHVLTSFLQRQGRLPDRPAAPMDGTANEEENRVLTEWIDQYAGALSEMFGEKSIRVLVSTGAVSVHSSTRLDQMLTLLTSFETGNSPGTWEWTATVLYLRTPAAQKAFEELTTGKTLTGATTTFSTEDSEAILREVSQLKDVEVISLPVLTTRPGATEKTFAGKESPDPVTRPDYWTGIKFQITNKPRGEEAGLELNTAQQSIDNPEDPAAAIAENTMSTKASIREGQTMLLGGLISEKDGETAVLLSAERYSESNLPFGLPAERAGMVFSPYTEGGSKMVDIAGLKRGTKVKCPFTGKLFRVP